MSLAAVNQICAIYEAMNGEAMNSKGSLKDCFENVNIIQCTAFWTYYKNGMFQLQVQSISGLTKVVRQYGDTFFACGQEGPPEEVFNVQSPNRSPNRSPTRDTSPMQNGYNHQSPPRRRVQNGTKEYRDEPRGRQYNISERQRRQTRNQPDGEDESPVRGRRNQQGMTPRAKQTPRRNDGDSTTPRRGNNTYRQDDDSDHSRSVTPNEEEMARKIGEMERIKSDLDGDIEY